VKPLRPCGAFTRRQNCLSPLRHKRGGDVLDHSGGNDLGGGGGDPAAFHGGRTGRGHCPLSGVLPGRRWGHQSGPGPLWAEGRDILRIYGRRRLPRDTGREGAARCPGPRVDRGPGEGMNGALLIGPWPLLPRPWPVPPRRPGNVVPLSHPLPAHRSGGFRWGCLPRRYHHQRC